MLHPICDHSTNLLTSQHSPPKAPILIISLKPYDGGFWIVEIFRKERPHKRYKTCFKHAQIITNLVREMKIKSFADITPEVRGWSAYIDRAVYPPPAFDIAPRDGFGVPYNQEDSQTEIDPTEKCPYCGSDDVKDDWVSPMYLEENAPDFYFCGECNNRWEVSP